MECRHAHQEEGLLTLVIQLGNELEVGRISGDSDVAPLLREHHIERQQQLVLFQTTHTSVRQTTNLPCLIVFAPDGGQQQPKRRWQHLRRGR